jgi:hypothetical protein
VTEGNPLLAGFCRKDVSNGEDFSTELIPVT